jgi:hypothetical protein
VNSGDRTDQSSRQDGKMDKQFLRWSPIAYQDQLRTLREALRKAAANRVVDIRIAAALRSFQAKHALVFRGRSSGRVR